MRRINKACIALLPKRPGATRPADFRPISLQNCDTKAVSKGLTTRLQQFISYLVHDNQTGFLKGKCISQNFVYAAEIVQACHKRGLRLSS
uniref:Uncharacterized protein n=1 Tax=Arundo donax TaxID=35708 RepID=A0A0A8ZXU4_ARUDO